MYVLQWRNPPDFPHAWLSRDLPNQVLNHQSLRKAPYRAIVWDRRDLAIQWKLAIKNPPSEKNLVPIEGKGTWGHKGGRAKGCSGRGGRGLGAGVCRKGRKRQSIQGASETFLTSPAG
jgi:hypothetical protein